MDSQELIQQEQISKTGNETQAVGGSPGEENHNESAHGSAEIFEEGNGDGRRPNVSVQEEMRQFKLRAIFMESKCGPCGRQFTTE